jgi:hypothetical protein
VLVLPSGTYSFNEDGLRRLRDWIRNGGTLITIAEASRWAARDRNNLLSTNTLWRDGTPEREARRGREARARARAAAQHAEAGHDQAVRLRQGDPARARTAREARPAPSCG